MLANLSNDKLHIIYLCRFVRQIKEVKLLVQSQNRQEMRDLPPRIYNLHIYVNRLEIKQIIVFSETAFCIVLIHF